MMSTSGYTHPHFAAIGPPLADALYLIAQDRADETAGLDREAGSVFAALLRDGREAAERIRTLVDEGQAPFAAEVAPDDWALLEGAAGVIVIRDDEGQVTAQPYESDENLAAAWGAVMADLEPDEPGSAFVESPESDENPT